MLLTSFWNFTTICIQTTYLTSVTWFLQSQDPLTCYFYDSIKLTLNIEGCVIDEQPVNRNFVFVFTLDAYDVGTFSDYTDLASCHTYGRLFTQQRGGYFLSC